MSASRIVRGRLFHSDGAANANLPSPKFGEAVRGTLSRLLSIERRAGPGRYDLMRSRRYSGPSQCTAWYVRVSTLKRIVGPRTLVWKVLGLTYWEPVQLTQNRGYVVTLSGALWWSHERQHSAHPAACCWWCLGVCNCCCADFTTTCLFPLQGRRPKLTVIVFGWSHQRQRTGNDVSMMTLNATCKCK